MATETKTRAEWLAEADRLEAEGDTDGAEQIRAGLRRHSQQTTATVDNEPSTPSPAPAPTASPGPSVFPGLARSFYQGFGVGTTDEAEAALRSLLPGHTYGEDVEQIRREQEAFSSQYPWLSGGADFMGGVLSPINLLFPGAGPEMSLARRAGQQMATGAAEGGIEGFMRAEGDIGERGIEGAQAAGLSAVLNPAFQGLAQLLPVAYRAGKGLAAPFFRTPEETAERQVARLLTAGGDSPEQVAEYVEGLGPTATLADVSRQTAERTAAARARSDVAGRIIDERMEARQRAQPERVRGYLEEAAGERATTANLERIKLTDEMARHDIKNYPDVTKTPVTIDQELRGIMETPYVQKLIKDARAEYQSRYRTDYDPYDLPDDPTMPMQSPMQRLMVFDSLKRLMDDRVGELEDLIKQGKATGGEKAEQNVLMELLTDLRQNLDRQISPGEDRSKYQIVREGHQNIARQLDALDAGRRLNRTRERQLDDLYEQMFGIQDRQTQTIYDELVEDGTLPGRLRVDRLREQDMVPFRRGAVEAMTAEVNRPAGELADVAGRLMRGHDAVRRLELMSASPEAAARLQDQLGGEMRQYDTMRLINPKAGSRTAILEEAIERGAEEQEVMREMAGAATGTMEGMLNMLANTARRAMMSPEVANALAELLTKPNVTLEEIERLMSSSRVPETVRDTVRQFMASGGETMASTAARQTGARLTGQ